MWITVTVTFRLSPGFTLVTRFYPCVKGLASVLSRLLRSDRERATSQENWHDAGQLCQLHTKSREFLLESTPTEAS
jgi:hypothetical protein